MFEEAEKYIDEALSQDLPEGTAAICFNIYEDDEDLWSFEIVAARSFDMNSDEWPCDEAGDFGTRDEPFEWGDEADWEEIEEKMCSMVCTYLEEGTYADKLKALDGVAVGFVDGDLSLVHVKLDEE